MKFPLIILGLSLSVFHCDAFAITDKMNACFLTINSSEEKNVFTKQLSTGKNAGKFEFHELAPQDSKQSDWFKSACQKNIRCDVLVVSGHFAGHFFGSSALSLEIGELEKRSCNNDCSGLMSDPKEVFLLGCNTLAGKDEDARSASEYLEVLVNDNIPIEQASRTVEQRYGAFGTSFKDGMKRAFKGVPHIYGFDSIGPSGKNIEGMLKKYHRKVPDYYDHLVKVELKRGLALMNDFTKWNQTNRVLSSALALTSFAQTSGVLIPCSGTEGISTSDPLYELLSNICKLRSDTLTPEEGIEHIKMLLGHDSFSSYIPVIVDYLSVRPDSGKKFDKFFEENPEVKGKILKLLENSKTGFGKLKIADFALKIGIISQDEFDQMEKKAVLSYLEAPVSLGSRAAICGYSSKDKIIIERKELKDSLFNDQNGLQALECLKLKDPEIVSSILKTAQEHKNQEMRKAAIWALRASQVKYDGVIAFLEDQMNYGKSDDEKISSLCVLASLGHGSSSMYEKLDQMFKSNKSVVKLGSSVSEYSLAFTALSSMKLQNYEQLKQYYSNWKSLKRKVDREARLFSSAISKLSSAEQIKFYNDTEIGDPAFRKEVRRNLYDLDHQVSLDVLSVYLDDLDADNTISTKLLSQMDLASDHDEEKFIRIIKDAKLSSEKRKELLSLDSFPVKSDGAALMEYMVELYESDKSFYGNELANYIHKKPKLSNAEKEILKPLLKTDNQRLKQKLADKKVTTGNPYSLLGK